MSPKRFSPILVALAAARADPDWAAYWLRRFSIPTEDVDAFIEAHSIEPRSS